MVSYMPRFELGITGQCCPICKKRIVIDRLRFGRAAGSCECSDTWIPVSQYDGTRTDNIVESVCCRKADSNE